MLSREQKLGRHLPPRCAAKQASCPSTDLYLGVAKQESTFHRVPTHGQRHQTHLGGRGYQAQLGPCSRAEDGAHTADAAGTPLLQTCHALLPMAVVPTQAPAGQPCFSPINQSVLHKAHHTSASSSRPRVTQPRPLPQLKSSLQPPKFVPSSGAYSTSAASVKQPYTTACTARRRCDAFAPFHKAATQPKPAARYQHGRGGSCVQCCHTHSSSKDRRPPLPPAAAIKVAARVTAVSGAAAAASATAATAAAAAAYSASTPV